MKPVNVKDNTYIDFKKEINDKNPKCKVGNYVRISKYKNITLLNLIKEQDSGNIIDKMYLNAKDLNDPKYQFLFKT